MIRILESKTTETVGKYWYYLTCDQGDQKPTGEFPAGSGKLIADGSRLFESGTEIKYEYQNGAWVAVGQIETISNDFVVTFTQIDDTSYNCDTSIDDIIEAYQSGKNVYGICENFFGGDRMTLLNASDTAVTLPEEDTPQKGAAFGVLEFAASGIYYSAVYGYINESDEDTWEGRTPSWDNA